MPRNSKSFFSQISIKIIIAKFYALANYQENPLILDQQIYFDQITILIFFAWIRTFSKRLINNN